MDKGESRRRTGISLIGVAALILALERFIPAWEHVSGDTTASTFLTEVFGDPSPAEKTVFTSETGFTAFKNLTEEQKDMVAAGNSLQGLICTALGLALINKGIRGTDILTGAKPRKG